MRTIFIIKTLLTIVLSYLLLNPYIIHAGQIKAISSKKNLVKVKLDTPQEFKKNSTICFFNNKEQKIACGKVINIKKDYAIVKVSSKAKSKIKKGMIAKPFTTKQSSSTFSIISAIVPSNTQSINKKYIFSIGQLTSIFTTASYNNIGYSPPDSNETPTQTLWTATDSKQKAYLGFFVEFGYALFSKFILDLDFHYSLYFNKNFSSKIITNYSYTQNIEDQNKYVSILTSQCKLLGGYLGTSFIFKSFTKSMLTFTSGLNLDNSSISILASQKDDNNPDENNPIAKISSNLNVISLKLGTKFYYFLFNKLGLYSKLDILIPIYASLKSNIEVSDPHENLLGDKSEAKNISSVLAHKKRSFALNLTLLGVAIRF